MSGIFHPYYTVALAPAVGALVGIGVTLLWRARTTHAATATLAVILAVTTGWSWHLLGRSTDWHPWLRTAVLVAGLAAAGLLLLVARLPRRVAPVVLALGAAAALAGPVGYSLQTASTAHTGAIPSAGPFVQGAFGPGRGGFPGGGQFSGFRRGGEAGQNGRFPRFPGGQDGAGRNATGQNGQFPGGAGRLPQGGGMGGLLDAREPSAQLKALLLTDADDYTWVAATVGSNNASGYQLATQRPVLPVGGFNGSDPSPTLAQFQRYVAEGRIHYFIGGDGFRANGGSSASGEIASWVTEHFTAKTVDGVTVYDLSSGK